MHTTNRRRLVALLVTTCLLAAACGGGDSASDDQGAADGNDGSPTPTSVTAVGTAEPDDSGTTSEPIAGGTLRFALNGEDDGLNPAKSRLSAPGLTIASAVFDTLTAFDKDGNAVPYLAKTVTPNDDYTVWTIGLRSGISFHDGTALNADAAIKTLQLQKADPTIGLAVRTFVKVGDPFVKVDDLTFEILLNEPWVYFPAFMAGLQFGMIASPTWLEAAAANPALNQEPVGTGPFRFESRTKDSITRLVRNDDYWNGPVYLDTLEFEIVPDGETRATLLVEGALDAMHTNEAEAIEVLRDDDTIENALDDTGDEQLDLINTSRPPFDDIRARKALTYATPQDNYVTLLGAGQLLRADQMFAPGSPFHNPAVVQETDQPEMAVAMAAEYCADAPENCTNGKIDMIRQTSGPSVGQTREADLLKQGWSVAFNVTTSMIPLDDHIEDVIFGEFQVADWRQFGAVDPSEDNVWLLCKTATSAVALNFPRFCSPERDALLLDAQNELDPARRAELYQELAAMVNQDYVYLFYAHTLWDIAMRDNVHGLCARTSPEGVALRCQVNGRVFFDKAWVDG